MSINLKDYHPKWSLIRRLILKRADNKCECCRAEGGEPHPITSYKVKLSVAHLDRDRYNNKFWNLAALCQRCHLIYDLCQRIFSFKYGKETQYRNGKLFHMLPIIVQRNNLHIYVPNYQGKRRYIARSLIHNGKLFI